MPALTIVLGGLLIALAWPRMMAGFERLPGEQEIETIQRGQPLAPERLDRLIASRMRALSWTEGDADLWQGLGLAQLAEQTQSGSSAGGIESAEAAFVAALRERPLDSHSWLRLAFVHFTEGRRAAIPALRLALLSAPYRPDQFEARIGMGLTLWPLLDADDRDLIRQQIRLMWAERPRSAIRLAQRFNREPVFRDALRLTPGALEAFERGL